MIFGHVIYKHRWHWKWKFSYERSFAEYRNWVTVDFNLRVGPLEFDGWLPGRKTL